MENLKLENIYKKTIICGVIFIVSFLPLLISRTVFLPANFGKGMVFRITIEILIFFYILLILKNKKYLFKFSIIDGTVLGLLFINIISAIFSTQPLYSFLGGVDRAGGIITLIHFIIFYFTLRGILQNRKDFNILLKSTIIGGTIVGLIAIAQRLGLNLISYGIPLMGKEDLRSTSTIGNPNFLGAYLLFIFFAYLTFAAKLSGLKTKILIIKSIYIFAAIISIIGIIFSGSKGAIAGLIIGFVFFFVLFPIISKKIRILSIAAGIIIGIFLINFAAGFANREFINIKPIHDLSLKIRSSMTTGPLVASLAPRLFAWKISVMAAQEKLFLGWGPENFEVGFNKYVRYPFEDKNPNLVDPTYGWMDRAHNFLVDNFVMTGILGILATLAVWGVLFLKSWKERNGKDRIIGHGIFTIFIAYFIQGLFNIYSITDQILFFFFLAAVSNLKNYDSGQITELIKTEGYSLKKSIIGKLTIGFIFILILPLVYFLNIRPLLANQKINKIVGTAMGALGLQGGGPKAAQIYEKDSRKIFKNSGLIALDGSLQNLLYFQITYGGILEKQNKSAEKLYRESIELFEKQIKIEPRSPRLYLAMGKLHLKLSIYDKKSKAIAINYFKKAMTLRPSYPESYLELGIMAISDNNSKKALEYFYQAYTASPLNRETNWWLGIAYILNGNGKEAQNFLWNSKKLNDKDSLKYLSLVYANTKNYRYLSDIYSKLIEIEPSNPQWYASLATTYKELGEYEKARQIARKIIEIKPEAKSQVKKFIEALD